MRLSLLVGALLAVTSPAAAQISVSAIRDLTFGAIPGGAASQVLASDAVKSGKFRITSGNGRHVRVQFTLPTRLNGPSGATLPIAFAAGDAVATGNAGNSNPVAFDPSAGQDFVISASTAIDIFLGGTVSPAANQANGAYANSIILTVTIQ